MTDNGYIGMVGKIVYKKKAPHGDRQLFVLCKLYVKRELLSSYNITEQTSFVTGWIGMGGEAWFEVVLSFLERRRMSR